MPPVIMSKKNSTNTAIMIQVLFVHSSSVPAGVEGAGVGSTGDDELCVGTEVEL